MYPYGTTSRYPVPLCRLYFVLHTVYQPYFVQYPALLVVPGKLYTLCDTVYPGTRYRYSNYITRYRYCRLQYCPIPGTYLNIQYPVHCIPGTGTRTGEVATVNFLLVPNTFYLVLFGFPCTSKKISSDLHQPHLASLQHHRVCCLVCRGFVSSCVLLVVCCVLLMH